MLLHILGDLIQTRIHIEGAGVDRQLGVLRWLIGRGDTGEVRDIPRSSL